MERHFMTAHAGIGKLAGRVTPESKPLNPILGLVIIWPSIFSVGDLTAPKFILSIEICSGKR